MVCVLRVREVKCKRKEVGDYKSKSPDIFRTPPRPPGELKRRSEWKQKRGHRKLPGASRRAEHPGAKSPPESARRSFSPLRNNGGQVLGAPGARGRPGRAVRRLQSAAWAVARHLGPSVHSAGGSAGLGMRPESPHAWAAAAGSALGQRLPSRRPRAGGEAGREPSLNPVLKHCSAVQGPPSPEPGQQLSATTQNWRNVYFW